MEFGRRRLLRLSWGAALSLLSGRTGAHAAMTLSTPVNDVNPKTMTLFLCGDVMTGRGIDQVLPHPGNPRICEAYTTSAKAYVGLAERANGPIPKPVGFTYVWGDALAELERRARRVAPGRVEMRGWVPPERIERVYDEARVVLVPSRWPEPFGMVGIEALRRGRPVVGAAHGGIPEWLARGSGGELFRPGSSESLALAVTRVLGDPDAGKRALTAARRFPFRDAMIRRINARISKASSQCQSHGTFSAATTTGLFSSSGGFVSTTLRST